MSIEEALYTRLSNHGGLSALVGTRIYPSVMPQGVTLPALTYRKTGGARVHAMGSDPGVARPRFELSCWSTSYNEAKDVGAQVRAALQRWRGTVSGVTVQDAFIKGEADSFEPDTGLHRVDLDFEINHQE